MRKLSLVRDHLIAFAALVVAPGALGLLSNFGSDVAVPAALAFAGAGLVFYTGYLVQDIPWRRI